MTFAISQCTELNLISQKTDTEFDIMSVTNELMELAMQTATVTEQQTREGQVYMNQHKDEEGQVDISAIEYVNSQAFQGKYQSQLAALHSKEQKLDVMKQQLETKQKTIAAQQDGWEKLTDKNIKTTFGYAQ